MSKKINVPRQPTWYAHQQLDHLLQAMAYVISQRQVPHRDFHQALRREPPGTASIYSPLRALQ